MRKFNLLVAGSILIFTSCTNHSEDDLINLETTPETVTFINDVKPIIDANCISCHGTSFPQGNLSLTTYSQVKSAVQNNGLLTRISLPDGNPSLMPTTGRMPQATIDLITAWNEDGLLE